jgi:4-hydroxythreonine-4-phosphate dehydrogenase
MEGHPGGTRAPLAVTMGDPAGIGLEITLMAWLKRKTHGLPPFLLFADPDAVTERAQKLNLPVPIAAIASPLEFAAAPPDKLPIVPIPLAAPAVPGQPDTENSLAVMSAIETAVAAVVAGDAAAVVTNPIAKNVLYAGQFPYPGHTEYLGALAERHYPGNVFRPVMMLACDALKIVPLTVHIPLAQVPSSISTEAITTTLRVMAQTLTTDFGIERPRIAVAGLNPHAGENGTLGKEDQEIVAPAIAQLGAEGMAVTGPHPADTLFHSDARSHYDAVLAMYHDQALIPVKTLAFERAVNVTLALPFVRTSPDHGTAFDIAGTGHANPSSLIASVHLAAALVKRRQQTSRVTPP